MSEKVSLKFRGISSLQRVFLHAKKIKTIFKGKRMSNKKIMISYLACPYTHADPKVKAWRVEAARRVAHYLILQGHFIYSPLTHNMPIDSLGIHGDWLTWRDFDHEMVARCDKLLVLRLSGWRESRGVQAEINHAKMLHKPIEEIDLPEEVKRQLNDFARKEGIHE